MGIKLNQGNFKERVYLDVPAGEHLCQFVKILIKDEELKPGRFVKAEDVGKIVPMVLVLFEIYPSKANKEAGESYNCLAKMSCSMTEKPQKSRLRKFSEYLSMDERLKLNLPSKCITDGDFLEEWISTYLNQWFYIRSNKGGWINFSDPLPIRPANPPNEYATEASQVAAANLEIRERLIKGEAKKVAPTVNTATKGATKEEDHLPETFDNYPDHSDMIDSEVL